MVVFLAGGAGLLLLNDRQPASTKDSHRAITTQRM
jgi:hypothetical protein